MDGEQNWDDSSAEVDRIRANIQKRQQSSPYSTNDHSVDDTTLLRSYNGYDRNSPAPDGRDDSETEALSDRSSTELSALRRIHRRTTSESTNATPDTTQCSSSVSRSVDGRSERLRDDNASEIDSVKTLLFDFRHEFDNADGNRSKAVRSGVYLDQGRTTSKKTVRQEQCGLPLSFTHSSIQAVKSSECTPGTRVSSKVAIATPPVEREKQLQVRGASPSDSSDDDDLFLIFNEAELAEIDRRVRERTAAVDGTKQPTLCSGSVGDACPVTHHLTRQEDTRQPQKPSNHDSLNLLVGADSRIMDDKTCLNGDLDGISCFDRTYERPFTESIEAEKDLVPNLLIEKLATDEAAFTRLSRSLSNRTDAEILGFSIGLDAEYHQEMIQANSAAEHDGALLKELSNEDTLDDHQLYEIHPSYYEPPAFKSKGPPIVHRFSKFNRPHGSRRNLSVSQVFTDPINKLWKSKFETFNHLQSEMANILAYSDDNIVVSAPTGAGKTVVFEMAMARFFEIDLLNSSQQPRRPLQISKNRKIVYVAPSKSLCEERFEDWSNRLSKMNLGVEVVILTGDGDPSEAYRELSSAHLILTTPEKWDSLTRRWTESFYLFASVKLFLVDEVHLVADESRGWCLESIICRMKTIQRGSIALNATVEDIAMSSYTDISLEALKSPMRLVAVSATLPNIVDIATFVDANEALDFDDSYRPVPLTTHVIGQGHAGEATSNQFRFWSNLDRNVPDIIVRFSKQRPSIVFCHSKADAEKLADLIATTSTIGLTNDGNSNIASQTRTSKLQRVLTRGVAYHHAGLDIDDRRLVEKSFRAGRIRVLCATSTLALGVNLPAQLVVIKGTKAWRGGGRGYQDIDHASLLQMIGRAGRPGFDSTGTAVIMTDNESKVRLQKMISSGLDPAHSKLATRIDEVINTEVAQRVICNRESAINWMKGTLFFVQLATNREVSGNQPSLFGDPIDSILSRLLEDSLQRLGAIGAFNASRRDCFEPLPTSRTMNQHMVTYQAMRLFVSLPFNVTQSQLLKAIVEIEELHKPVRRSEKKVLKDVHKSTKYKLDGAPSKVTIQSPAEKAFVLLQASIGHLFLEDYTLRQEMNSIVEYASRMLSALEEYGAKASHHGAIAVQSLRLRRSLATSIWNSNTGVLNQLMGVGPSATYSLQLAGINSFEQVLNSTEESIEKGAKRLPPFGSNLRTAVSKILGSTLKLSARLYQENAEPVIVCELERRQYSSNLPVHEHDRSPAPAVTYTLLAYTDQPGGCLIYQKNVDKPGCYEATIPITFGRIICHLIASMVGLDESVVLKGIGVDPELTSSQLQKRVKHAVFEGTCPHALEQKKIALTASSAAIATCDHTSIQPRQARATSCHISIPTEAIVSPSPRPDLAVPMESIASNHPHQEARSRIHKDRLVLNQSAIHAFPSSHHFNQEQDPTVYMETISANRELGLPLSRRLTPPMNTTWVASPQPSPLDYGSAPKRRFDLSNRREPWKKARHQQERTQIRAFVRKKDNPFSKYRHDPNTAESYLHNLSLPSNVHKVSSGIIPQDALRRLTEASIHGHQHNLVSNHIIANSSEHESSSAYFDRCNQMPNELNLNAHLQERFTYQPPYKSAGAPPLLTNNGRFVPNYQQPGLSWSPPGPDPEPQVSATWPSYDGYSGLSSTEFSYPSTSQQIVQPEPGAFARAEWATEASNAQQSVTYINYDHRTTSHMAHGMNDEHIDKAFFFGSK